MVVDTRLADILVILMIYLSADASTSVAFFPLPQGQTIPCSPASRTRPLKAFERSPHCRKCAPSSWPGSALGTIEQPSLHPLKQALQTRTRPPEVAKAAPVDDAGRSTTCRWPEHRLQTTLPHFRQ